MERDEEGRERKELKWEARRGLRDKVGLKDQERKVLRERGKNSVKGQGPE